MRTLESGVEGECEPRDERASADRLPRKTTGGWLRWGGGVGLRWVELFHAQPRGDASGEQQTVDRPLVLRQHLVRRARRQAHALRGHHAGAVATQRLQEFKSFRLTAVPEHAGCHATATCVSPSKGPVGPLGRPGQSGFLHSLNAACVPPPSRHHEKPVSSAQKVWYSDVLSPSRRRLSFKSQPLRRP